MLGKAYKDFFEINRLVYQPCGWAYKNMLKETEGEGYGACTFEMHDRRIVFRVAKITPIKVGQFVTLWKRVDKGPIMPYDMEDPIDLFIVVARRGDDLGQFIFPKSVLQEKGIVSKGGRGGKRAMRVYPAWDITDNAQAKKTQKWQLNYFFQITSDQPIVNSIFEELFL